MWVGILVFAGSLAIMSVVVLPGHLPARSTGHTPDKHGGDGHGVESAVAAPVSGAANIAYTVLLVLILCLAVAAGFSTLSNM